tara:strand:+ start:610 stop:747 length:138 start_codon:yes stop_codon:yes gene_type:complete
MDSIKIATISFSNYFIGLTQVHEALQVIVALLSIVLLLMNIKKGR